MLLICYKPNWILKNSDDDDDDCELQNLIPDYSMESHVRDLENYVNVARNKRRRAKALIDFERHDDDELGFRKNDIITVSDKLSQW